VLCVISAPGAAAVYLFIAGFPAAFLLVAVFSLAAVFFALHARDVMVDTAHGFANRRSSKKTALVKSSFHEMIASLTPALPPWGAGAYYDASALPEPEISPRLRTGNMAQSQWGDAIATGAEPRRTS
jgi:hypothetical protein